MTKWRYKDVSDSF
uniref:Uncharacterized protein n=1 Tax=Anguilla anguilla TaxID=7936 RepID=A0A0E9SIM8_ANGAN